MRIFANANFPFLQWRRYGLAIAGALMIGSIAAMAVNVATLGSWLNYGVDFSGGTLVQVAFDQPVEVEQIRAVNSDWQISRFGEADEFVIRMPTFEQDAGEDASTRVGQQLDETFGAGSYEIVRTEAVGPTVGAELQQKALIALVLSSLMMLIYVAVRFTMDVGVASVGATVHDIIFTLGVLAILRTEVSIGTVAAFLTVVGYSMNDTIVVFDRVRENMARVGSRADLTETLNKALNETLPRTLITSGTTLATLLALYLFGGEVIRDFALVLILGVAIGTFSSIFVAPPILLYMRKRWPQSQGKSGRGTTSASRKRETAVV